MNKRTELEAEIAEQEDKKKLYADMAQCADLRGKAARAALAALPVEPVMVSGVIACELVTRINAMNPKDATAWEDLTPEERQHVRVSLAAIAPALAAGMGYGKRPTLTEHENYWIGVARVLDITTVRQVLAIIDRLTRREGEGG